MALSSINTHPGIVKEMIFRMEQEEWEDYIINGEKYLDGTIIYPIENEVNL